MLASVRIQNAIASASFLLDTSYPTIVVGPNNCGKTLLLREIEQAAQGVTFEKKIISEVQVTKVPGPELANLLGRRAVPQQHNNIPVLLRLYEPPESQHVKRAFPDSEFERLQKGTIHPTDLYAYASLYMIRLDGSSRLGLLNHVKAGDLLGVPRNHLASLFVSDDLRKRLRDLVHEAFGKYLVIDPTDLGNLHVRLSAVPPQLSLEEQALDARAREFHHNADPIDIFSDGVRAYAGILAAVLSGEYRAALIDEPEAFLHPPLASLLGQRLAELSREKRLALVAATHSPAFLEGVIRSGVGVNVLRLGFDGSVGSAKLLSAEGAAALVNNTLLRSASALNGLFHRAAIVVEGDSDRVFYQEINSRLVDSASGGLRDAVFLNAQNAHTISKIVGPLRRVGVPAAAIIDMDFAFDSQVRELLLATGAPESSCMSLGTQRQAVWEEISRIGVDRDAIKRKGVDALSGDARQSAVDYFDHLGRFGVFVVEVGELEGWLRNSGVEASKRDWIVKMFEYLGNRGDPDWVKPSEGDVWSFVRRVANWCADSATLKRISA